MQGFRLSPEQAKIWHFIEKNGPNNSQIMLQLDHHLTLDRISASLAFLYNRYDILRTVFKSSKERKLPLQVVRDVNTFVLKQYDLKANEDIQRVAYNALNTSFNLESDLLWQPLLIRKDTTQYLIITASSMILDSGSLSNLVNEFSVLLEGNTLSEDELLSYAQVSEWQHSLSDDIDDDAINFWSSFASPSKVHTSVTFSHSRKQESYYQLNSFSLGNNFVHALKQMAENNNTDISSLLAYLVSDFLSRFSISEELSIQITEPFRGYEEISSVIGNLSQTLPFTINKPLFNENIEKGLDQFQKIREFGLYYNSIHHLNTDFTKKYDLEIHLPIQVTEQKNIKPIHLVSMRGCSGIQVSILEMKNDFNFQILFNQAFVDNEWATELGHSLFNYLSTTLNQQKCIESNSTWLSEEQQKQLLSTLSETSTNEKAPLALELLEQSFEQHSGGMAVIHGMKWMNFNQLSTTAEIIAKNLIHQGIKPGDTVGILLPRSIEAITTIIGVLKAGACYIPIDTEYPNARIEYIIKDAKLAKLITTDTHSQLYSLQVSCTTPAQLQVRLENTYVLPTIDADSTAYVIYTSGSTGFPKGCEVSHSQLSWYLDYTQKTYFNTISASNVPLFTSLAFDLTITSIFGSLISGNTLTIYDESNALNNTIASIFAPESNVKVIKLTPAHTMLIPETGLKTTGVERVIIGGEALLETHLKQLFSLNSDMEVYNEYGPTETVVGCSVELIRNADEPISIGKPVDYASMFIVDSKMNLLPAGVAGELIIGGKSVSKGYLNQQSLTSEKFVSLKYTKERVYKSGDLATFAPNGKFYFLGRIDNQIKLRGYRIEIDEIRVALLKIEGVKDAFVKLASFEEDTPHLVAYLVHASTKDEQRIKDELSAVLPFYMVPSFILFIDEIPLTVNGKVNSDALPDLKSYIDSQKRTLRNPENELQSQLKAIWEEVLKVEHISIDDNFFDLGGHSLKAMQIVSRIQHSLNLDLLLSDFFDHLTIEALDLHLKKKDLTSDSVIQKCEKADFYVCSGSQKRLWVLDKLPGAKKAYHISGIYVFQGPLNAILFNKSIERMIMRHEILRTSFLEVHQTPMQVIHNTHQPMVEYMDITSHTNKEQVLEQITEATIHGAFDLSSPHLFRSVLIKTDTNKFRWAVCMHHIISDGWSVDLMIDEIQRNYELQLQSESASLSPLAIQFKEYASYLREQQILDTYIKKELYWINAFKSPIKAVTLPFQKKRPRVKTHAGSSLKVSLPKFSVKGLQALHKQGFSSFITLTTALSYTIQSLIDQDEFVIGTPVAGRTLPEIEPLIGFFVNLIPLKIKLKPNEAILNSLKRVRSTIMEAIENQDIEFDSWTSKLNHATDPSRSPLFDILIVYHNNPSTSWNVADISMEAFPIEEKYSKYDLVTEFTETKDEIELRIDYNSDLFDSEDIEQLSQLFSKSLEVIVTKSDTNVVELPKLLFKKSESSVAQHQQVIDSQPQKISTPNLNPDSLEHELQLVWENVLGHTDIRNTDNFFSIGGDSIKAIQMASALYQKGYRLTVSNVFSYPTIKELVSKIEQLTVSINQNPILGTHKCTPIQQWLLSKKGKTPHTFFQSALIKLESLFPLSLIKKAWNDVMLHHDELRAKPIKSSNGFELKIESEIPNFKFNHIIYQGNDIQKEVIEFLSSYIDNADVYSDSLCNVLVLTHINGKERYIFLLLHHLLVDIVSWHSILNDFHTIVDAMMVGAKPSLPAKTTSFIDWMKEIDQAQNTSKIAGIRTFWENKRDVLKKNMLDSPKSDYKTTFTLTVDQASEKLSAFSQNHQLTFVEILATAISRAMFEGAKIESITILQEVHGRDLIPHATVDRTVGWFTTEYPIPIPFIVDIQRHLREVKETVATYKSNGGWFMQVEPSPFIDQIQQTSIGFNYLGEMDTHNRFNHFNIIDNTKAIDTYLESKIELEKPISMLAFLEKGSLILNIQSTIELISAEALGNLIREQVIELLSENTNKSMNLTTPSDYDYDGLDIDTLDDLINSID